MMLDPSRLPGEGRNGDSMSSVPRAHSELAEDVSGGMVWNRDALLEMFEGDEKFAGVVVAEFLECMPGRMGELNTALADGGMELAQRLAHAIKGLAGSVGGERMRSVAAALEAAARSGDRSVAATAFEELQREFERLERETRAECVSSGTPVEPPGGGVPAVPPKRRSSERGERRE